MTEVQSDIFKDLQYAEELKAFVRNSKDVVVSADTKLKILNYNNSALLLVTKKIASPTEILDVKVFDDDSIKEAFPSF